MRSGLAVYLLAGALMGGCGSDDNSAGRTQTGTATTVPVATSSPRGGTAPTTPAAPGTGGSAPAASTPEVRRFRGQATSACARTHRIRGPRNGGAPSAQAYARAALPLAIRTVRTLEGLRPPPAERNATGQLIATYRQVIPLYQQLAAEAPSSPAAKQTAPLMASLNRQLAAQAQALGLPGCGPPVG